MKAKDFLKSKKIWLGTTVADMNQHENYFNLEDLLEEYHQAKLKLLDIPVVITPLLSDKAIEEYIWEEIPISLSQIDIDTHSDEYIRYLNAVHWAKWGRDNCNGL